MNVLILDDDIFNRRILCHALCLDGWNAMAFDENADVLGLIRQLDIGVLITDYDLKPMLTGLDVIETIRKAGISIPALILSGNVHRIDRHRAKRLNVSAIVEKPASFGALRKILSESVIAGRQLDDETPNADNFGTA